MRRGFLFLGIAVLARLAMGIAGAETVSVPVVPASLWKGGGQDVDVTATRAQAMDEPDAVLFSYALLGGQTEYGNAEYLYRDAIPFTSLPKRARIDFKGEVGGAMVQIRFIDSAGTIFQWNLSKVDFVDWQPIQREFHPAEDGYVAYGPRIKEIEGGSTTTKISSLVPPFKFYSILLARRFLGDDERRSFGIRHLEIEY